MTENWITAFTQKHGRPPRILHVGNINNNAYQTAKMLNERGADCDVLCADYYHTLGNPEWDDADIEGDVGDQFFPALHQVNLNGFARPRWFSQGPRHLAIRYLLARRAGDEAKASRLWRKMERARRYLVWREKSKAKRIMLFLEKLPLRLKSILSFPFTAVADLARDPRLFKLKTDRVLGRLDEAGLNELWDKTAPGPVFRRIRADAAALFPDRALTFGYDTELLIQGAMDHQALFEQYDIVQAYALDPIWPYLCGSQSYVAYEHGTLRDTPYEDNDQSRLCLLAYARAKAVYVTNVDCYDSALYITKNSGAPLVCGLHGFDTERMLQKQQAARNLAFDRAAYAAPEQKLFFCPARVDIDPHYGTYLKKNDMLYRALGRLYKERPGQFKILQLEWGHDVDALKALIEEIDPGMAQAVVWRQPFQKAEYYQILQNCELVFDNLLLPLMGGNGIETLMSGHAALVNKRIPKDMMLRFFPEMWPILPIDNEDDVYNAAKTALDDPAACLAIAQKAQQWILQYHGHEAIVQRNLQAYQLVSPLP